MRITVFSELKQSYLEMHRDIKILVLSIFLWEIGLTLYDPLLSVYLRQLGASPEQVGLVFSIAYFVMAVTSLPGGWLADRFDRRKTMIFFWVIGAPSILLIAAAQIWWQAIPGVMLYFLSFMTFPAINAYLTDAADPRRLSAVFGLLYIGFPIATLVGPGLGGFLADQFGFQVVFLLSFGFFLVSTFVIFMLTPQHPKIRSTSPADIIKVIRNPNFFWFSGLAALIYVFFTAMLRFTSPYLYEIRGYNLFWVGLLSSLTAVGGILLVPMFSFIGDHRSRKWTILLGIGMFSISLILIGWTTAIVLLVLAFFLQGSYIASRPQMDAIVGQFAKSNQTGWYFGVFGLFTGLAQTISPLVGGLLYDLNPNAGFILTGIIGFSLLLLLRITRFQHEN